MCILFLTHSHSELKPFLCYPVFYYKQLVHLSTLFTRPLTYVLLLPCLLLQATRPLVHLVNLFTCLLTCVLLLPCLLLQATRPLVHLFTCLLILPCLLLETTCSLVHLVHSSTHITTYIFLGIGFLVLYLCIVIRNEGMTNGVLMKQTIYNN